MAFEVFISYRRRDTGGYAGRLYDHLVQKFGSNGVLFDVEVEGTAESLPAWVARVVPDAAVELVLIGEDWLLDRQGRRRLHEPNDVVRLEIELALAHQVPLIPVIIDTARFPTAIELPESIRALADFKGYDLNNSYWTAKTQLLDEAILSATKTHVPILRRGVREWNAWRGRNRDVTPNLAFGELSKMDLAGADFQNANMRSVNLGQAILRAAVLSGADLTRANLEESDLSGAIFRGAHMESVNLSKTNLQEADFTEVDLTRANLENASVARATFVRSCLRGASLVRSNLEAALIRDSDLSGANLNEANLDRSSLSDCRVFGVSTWGTLLRDSKQTNLSIAYEATGLSLSVDGLEVGGFVNMLLGSGHLRSVVDTITTRFVLILGRFTSERRLLLDALRTALLSRGYSPVVFAFEKPASRDMLEPIWRVAALARFVIADITDANSLPRELMEIVPKYRVPVQPLLLSSQQAFAMFEHFLRYPWVLPVVLYDTQEQLLEALESQVIAPAERALAKQKTSRQSI